MTGFLQLTIQGLALGSVYALVALGFVVIYKSTGVINFAQGDLMMLGAYVVFSLNEQFGFYAACALAIVVMAGVGWTVERTVLRPMVGKPVFAIVMITIALAIIVRQVVAALWGFEDRFLGDPWGSTLYHAGGVRISLTSTVTIVTTAVLLAGFFAFFRYTRMGVAMRATAFDPEAAMGVGIDVGRVYSLSWVLAASIATFAGVFLAAFPNTLSPNLGFTALRAFPAAILGGLDSPSGAVVGGLVIGLVELWTQGYQPAYAPWLGNNVHIVAAYALMIVVLVVRPYGLFGTKEVERV